MTLTVNDQPDAMGKTDGLIPRQPQKDFCVGLDNANPAARYVSSTPFEGSMANLTHSHARLARGDGCTCMVECMPDLDAMTSLTRIRVRLWRVTPARLLGCRGLSDSMDKKVGPPLMGDRSADLTSMGRAWGQVR